MQRVMVDVPGGDEIEVDIDSWRNTAPLTTGLPVDLLWQDSASVRLERE